ncbi:MAG: hypothetical protein K9M07_03685 [Simkaniaceae bacterium]|nr:hypothetical protein [Simkaniaceae bacterium]
MKKWLFGLATLLFSFKAFAALPPHQEMARQINAILSSSEISEKCPQGIRGIESTIDGGYMITTNDGFKMRVDVIGLPSDGTLGPKKFKLRFHELDSVVTRL